MVLGFAAANGQRALGPRLRGGDVGEQPADSCAGREP